MCAGLPSNTDFIGSFNGQYVEDFGGPLICLDDEKKPIFTGVTSSNSLSRKHKQPGIYTNLYKNKNWIKNVTAFWSEWTECLGSCVSSRRRVCSEHFGCNGREYEEKKCPNSVETCFQSLTDTLPSNLKYCSMFENTKLIKSRKRRVVNGISVQKSWDWIVRLEFLNDFSDLASICGGTVINRNFVLTAAHCCLGKDYVIMTFKDKSRRIMESEQFQLRSRLFRIYPEYGKIENSQNFDVCLIKTPTDNFGVHFDLSTKFFSVPCLVNEIDLTKVCFCKQFRHYFSLVLRTNSLSAK